MTYFGAICAALDINDSSSISPGIFSEICKSCRGIATAVTVSYLRTHTQLYLPIVH